MQFGWEQKLYSVVSVPPGFKCPITVGPARVRCPVAVLVSGLYQPRQRARAVHTPVLGAEAVYCRQRATWSDFEDRSSAVGPAKIRCPIEVAIGGLGERRLGIKAVGAVRLRAEAIKHCLRAIRGDLEHRSHPP